GGETAKGFIAAMRAIYRDLPDAGDELAPLRSGLVTGVDALDHATSWILAQPDPRDAAAGAMSYLRLWGTVAGGWLMARAAIAAKADLAKNEGDPDFLRAKILTARFYGEQILPRASSFKAAATAGASTLMAMPDTAF